MYGAAALSLPYEAQLGLWLNAPDELLRGAWAAWQGARLAGGLGAVDWPIFAAAALLEEQADALFFAENEARAKEEARHKAGG